MHTRIYAQKGQCGPGPGRDIDTYVRIRSRGPQMPIPVYTGTGHRSPKIGGTARTPCKTKNRAVAHRQCHVHPAAAWQQQRRRVGAGYTNMPVARPRSPDGPPARQCAELQARRAGQTCRWQLTAALNLKYVYAHTKHGCGGIEIMNSGYPTDQ